MKIRLFFGLLAVLAVFAFSCGLAAAEEPVVEFYDVGNHWAGETIAQCKTYQLMSGYPGNLFMPDRNLSRAEALAVIGRSLGWDKQLGSVSTSGIKFQADLWSGFKGYVAVAAEKQLINRNAIPLINFNDPATRMEMALWLAQALNLTGNGNNLNFNDLKDIPVAYRSMLAGVVEAGIFKGMPGNLFAPSRSLTRAEMATILARLVDDGKLTPPTGRQVTGTLKNISWAQQKITVEQPYGANTYDLASPYMVFRQGRKSDPTDIMAGENVKISLNQSGKCVLIAYQDGSQASGEGTKSYTGTVLSYSDGLLIFKPDTGSSFGFTLSPAAVITVSGASATTGSVKAGARGTITVSGGKVTRMDLTGGTTAPTSSGDRGYVVNKYWDYFTVRLGYGWVEEIQAAGVSFTLNNFNSSYGALKRGTYVELIRSGSAVRTVNILDGDRKVFGEVEQVNSMSISIEDEDGKSFSYNIYRSARVLNSDGDHVDIDDLEAGDDVEITLDDNDQVREIKANVDSVNDLEGRVESISTSGSKRITIEDKDGDSHTYYLADSVTVREGSSTRSLGSVEEDMWVELTLDNNNDVTLIKIVGYSVVEGEVTDIRTSGTKRIDIEESDGDEETYYIDNDVTVKEGSAARTLDYIDEGMEVRLTLDVDSRVTRIEIIDESTVEGEVIDIITSGSDRIRIEKSNGDIETYYLDDDVTVKEDGSSRDLDDVEEGMEVRLTLDSSGDVTRIDILDESESSTTDVEGEVTHIQTTGNNRFIEIEESGGDEEIYDLADSVTVREGSETRSLNYIIDGMRVELTLNSSGDVTRIDINESSGTDYVEGEVTGIWTSGTDRIEVRESDGDEKIYYIDNYVTVEEDGRDRDLDDVEEGMYVRLTLDGNEVTHIEIYGEETIEGVVTYIRTTGTERIEIEKSNGDDEIYYLDDDVPVREDGDSRNLDDIKEGMEVRLILDRDDEVTLIEITGVSYVRGEVTYIRTTGTERIEIEDSDGDDEIYYIDDDVAVWEGGSRRDLDDVEDGMDVKLTLDSDERVTRIDIL
ncbi:MAG: S-layer homology domain-containing protein [Bacillota bacterium]